MLTSMMNEKVVRMTGEFGRVVKNLWENPREKSAPILVVYFG